MRDTNLLLTDTGVAADAFAANALQVNKTPAEGIWLQFHVTKTGADSDERLDIKIYGKDTDASWATTDNLVGAVPGTIGSGMATNDVAVKYCKVQAKNKFIKPHYDVTGTTPGFTIVCGVVSGPDQIATA